MTKYLGLLFFCGLSIAGLAQSKEDLVNRKTKIEKEILLSNELLSKNVVTRQRNIDRLGILNNKIVKRQELISIQKEEIENISKEIERSKDIIVSLEKDLLREKKFYADLIRSSYKTKETYQNTVYLLASKNINQFYSRLQHLRTLRKVRSDKILLIKSIEEVMSDKIALLEIDKEKKIDIVNELLAEESILTSEVMERNRMISSLKGEERQIKNELKKKEKLREEIEKQIQIIINAEIKKNRYASLTPEQKLISDDFEKNKGRLPWPTSQGIITEKFGLNPHPVLKGVKVQNNGIDITSVKGSKVRSVFGGEVTRIASIKGAKYTVIIRHGEYFTVYHNLETVSVSTGDKIAVKSEIGLASSIEDGSNATLHFEIWKGLDKLNPIDWISD